MRRIDSGRLDSISEIPGRILISSWSLRISSTVDFRISTYFSLSLGLDGTTSIPLQIRVSGELEYVVDNFPEIESYSITSPAPLNLLKTHGKKIRLMAGLELGTLYSPLTAETGLLLEKMKDRGFLIGKTGINRDVLTFLKRCQNKKLIQTLPELNFID